MPSTKDTPESPAESPEHEDKAEMMYNTMEQCCAGMTFNDKKKMMDEMMPRMMQMMGGKGPGGIMSMAMKHCMKGFRWFPLVPLVFGVSLFLIGYFLDGEVLRILWLILAVPPILMGLFALVMMSSINRP